LPFPHACIRARMPAANFAAAAGVSLRRWRLDCARKSLEPMESRSSRAPRRPAGRAGGAAP
jgi:hypothetical protein